MERSPNGSDIRDRNWRVGLIGFGLGGAAFHAPFIATTAGLVLDAIATSNPARREQAVQRYPAARVFAGAAEMLAGATDLDIAVISSPNRTHIPLAIQCLNTGLHVVVDKPLAASIADAVRAIETARERKKLLTVYQNRRWDGDFLTVRHLIAAGRLGRVFRFESRFTRWRPVPSSGWRMLATPEDAGGLLFDIGSHLIDQALMLFGPVTHVYAELDRQRPGAQIDDDSFVALTHASGVRSHLWMSGLDAQPGPRFRVLGDKGAYVKFGMDVQEEMLRSGGNPSASGWGEDPPDLWGRLGTEQESQAVRTERGAYGEFYRVLVSALDSGSAPPVDPADAVATLEIVEAARRSHAHGQIICMTSR
jgi:predicted dehydrogenase